MRSDENENDRTGPSDDVWFYWITARWAFLVFNVAVVTGWIFWLMWTGRGYPWVVWTTRSLITVQVIVAIVTLLAAYRRCLIDESSRTILGEAWVYLFMTLSCCFTMGLSMV